MAGSRCVIFFLAALNSVFCSSNFVPVVLWQSPSLGNDLPSVSAVGKISTNEFEADILNKLDSRAPVLFFLQDDLSLEDFTLWGNVYGKRDKKNSFSNIENLLDSNPSTMLPSVQSPEHSISMLANGRKVVEIKGDEFSPKDKMDNSLYIFHLPNTDVATDRQQALSKNDQIIGDVIKKVAEKSPVYSAVYTGHTSSWVSAEEDHIRPSRHVLAMEDATSSNYTGVYTNGTCCIVYFEDIVFDYYSSSGPEATEYTVQSQPLNTDRTKYAVTCTCESNVTSDVMITFTGDPADNVTNLLVIMAFSTEASNDWYLAAMTVEYTLATAFGESGVNWLDVDSNFWAPMTFSYHCAPQTFMEDTYNVNVTVVNSKGGVTFGNLQVQPFINEGGVFGDAFDCVGFFTISIWMGIFVVGILIIILGFGIHMTLSINTMDRFDDPKGKTITVNAID